MDLDASMDIDDVQELEDFGDGYAGEPQRGPQTSRALAQQQYSRLVRARMQQATWAKERARPTALSSIHEASEGPSRSQPRSMQGLPLSRRSQ